MPTEDMHKALVGRQKKKNSFDDIQFETHKNKWNSEKVLMCTGNLFQKYTYL